MPSPTHLSASSAPANCRASNAALGAVIPVAGYCMCVLVSTAGCAADLLTKHWVFQWRGLPPSSEWWLWEPYVGIQTAVNTGALFGMGPGLGRGFAALSVAAALGIVTWLFWFRAARDRWLTVALSLVMAGVLGNLYDRLGLWWQPGMREEWSSGVRDWILFRYGSFTWPNFNIADSLLVCGAAMLFFHSAFERKDACDTSSTANQSG